MIYSATFLSPNNIAVDGINNNTFSWVSNGDKQTAFQLYIRNNDDNSLAYDSGKIDSINSSHVVLSGALTNGIIYKWMVKTWSSLTTYSESEWVVFSTKATPIASMVVNDLNAQNYNFTVSYNDVVKYFKFTLFDSNGKEILNSGSVYSQTVEYEITGLVDGLTYQIECVVVNQEDVKVTTGKKTFTTNYDKPVDIPSLVVTSLDDIGAIKLSWEQTKQVLGVTDETYSYVSGKFNNGLHLDQGSKLIYKEIIPTEFTSAYWLKLSIGFKGDIVTIGDDFRFGYDGKRFYYKDQYRITGGQERNIPSDYFLIGIKPSTVIIDATEFTEIIR